MDKNKKFNIIIEGQKNGVSKTCEKYEISRTLYYRWLKKYKIKGINGLDNIRKKVVPKNKTSKEIENETLNLIKIYPRNGPREIKYLLEEIGYNISESAIFNIMKRNDLTNKKNRMIYSRKKEVKNIDSKLNLEDMKSGECWFFWITDYGKFENIGKIYEYTIFDYKSKIACSRLYQKIDLIHFEDLLTGVAMPVAHTLNMDIKNLCFFQKSEMILKLKNSFRSKIKTIINNNDLNVNVNIIHKNKHLKKINDLRNNYTKGCISYLIPYIQEELSFDEIKIKLQQHIREYNLNNKMFIEGNMYSPVEYHVKSTETNLILPLWAYIERIY
ncbi:MAG: helix-turn-helix domain-containing protein [Thermotogota bacterium]